ncbi:MAG: flagellar assembly protein FliX, partial [Parvularculaceae bacterium]
PGGDLDIPDTQGLQAVGWRGFLDYSYMLESLAALLLSTALGALIALQSETDGRRRNRAAAERALLLLERLRDGLLAGRIERADLERLADAASAKLDDPDPSLAALWADIELRARVELAKFRL